MDKQKYYFITVMEKLETSELGYPKTGARRCWGFYTDKEKAFQCVHENWTDLWETCYNYALIEEYEEGIAGYTFFRQFFKYDEEKDGYIEIGEPAGYKHFSSFAL